MVEAHIINGFFFFLFFFFFEHCLGELPLIQNLNHLPAGWYVFNVSATDIYRLRGNFIIEYTSKYK